MKKTEIKIASVKLINYGLKGLVVKHASSEKGAKGIVFGMKDQSERNRPIHSELEECIHKLKSKILDICSYTVEPVERESLLENLNITFIEASSDGFKIKADLVVLDGTLITPIETPFIENDSQYPEFHETESLIIDVFQEAKEYLTGTKTMDELEFIAKMNKGNAEFDFEATKALSETERTELYAKFLEEKGCIVLMAPEVNTEENGVAIDTTQTPFTVVKDEPVIENSVMMEADGLAHTPTEDDDIDLGITSTAKVG